MSFNLHIINIIKFKHDLMFKNPVTFYKPCVGSSVQ